jgi:AcrR family transcriptional regulator
MTAIDGRLARGARTRAAVLDAAVTLAAEVGLDGLSLGQLAQRLGVSKSGLFAHWRDKEQLQLATLERAREQFATEVVSPALAHPRGVRRLWALHAFRLEFYARSVLPDCCFVVKVSFEYADQPGAVRDRIIELNGELRALYAGLVSRAIECGELRPVDPELLAFEMDSVGLATVYDSRLFDRHAVFTRARRAVLDRLRPLCTDPALLPEE